MKELKDREALNQEVKEAMMIRKAWSAKLKASTIENIDRLSEELECSKGKLIDIAINNLVKIEGK